ncbi:hypothetical protein JW835_03550 [bacterium]|nr:hypothetical protein [bacterium]RQV98219.1 MAG: hypothetical protein EH221_02285 [bacterium]
MKKRMIYSVVIALLIAGTRSLCSSGDAGQPGAFLRYGVGARAMGMGRAFVAIADDASAVYWNPSCMLEAERAELSSMYSNLYYDSRYAYIGLILPRLLESAENPWLRWFFGPDVSWGVGWTGLSMVGFEQRTRYNEYLGQFDMGENAWMLSWAKERVGQFGILRAGITYKIINQQFTGLNNHVMTVDGAGPDWSNGLDIGLTFRPIHAPVFRVVSLKYLLPLQLGMSIQNLVQPGWDKVEGASHHFPRVYRYGFSYRFILQDWIPEAWNFRYKLGNMAVLFAFDREHYSGADAGTYFGMEGQIPITALNVWLLPRFGVNNQTEGRSLGFGFSMPFSSAAFKLDYVHTSHPVLEGDTRFCLSVQFRHPQNAGHFQKRAHDASLSKEMLRYDHLVLSKYPNEYLENAVNDIAATADRPYEKRLYALVGGMRHAELLLEDANLLLRKRDIVGARRKALESSRAYAPNFLQTENYLTGDQMIDYGEALIISGKMRDAVTVLEEIEEPTIRANYLLGTGYQGLSDSRAIEAFNSAVNQVKPDQNDLVALSYLGWAESLVKDKQYQPAMMALSSLLNYNAIELGEDYPRFPIFEDHYIQDDAMFLMGITQIMAKNYQDGVSTLYKTLRYYPVLTYGETSNQLIDELTIALERKDFDRLDTLANDMLLSYYSRHDPSNRFFE